MAHPLNQNRRTRGVILIEMALILPLLLLITFAVLEYGWMFTKMGQVTNAARQGARIGVRPDATSADVNTAIDTFMSAAGFTTSQYTKSMSPSDPTTVPVTNTFTVTVTVTYSNITLTGFPLVPTPAQLQAVVKMAKEGPPS